MVGMTCLPRLRIRFLKRGHIEIHLRFLYPLLFFPFYISNVSDATVSVPLSSVDKNDYYSYDTLDIKRFALVQDQAHRRA